MRDVSKILSDAEVLKLRALLSQTPTPEVRADAFEEYPKMLFHPEWLTCYRLVKDHPDPLVKKEAKEKIRSFQHIATDFEDEEEYLTDGWKSDPNDLIIAANLAGGMSPERADPRVPTGREGRRADRQNRQSREDEIRNLKRRYAELTGHRMVDDEPLALASAGNPDVGMLPVTAQVAAQVKKKAAPASKRERVAAATRRATGQSAHV